MRTAKCTHTHTCQVCEEAEMRRWAPTTNQSQRAALHKWVRSKFCGNKHNCREYLHRSHPAIHCLTNSTYCVIDLFTQSHLKLWSFPNIHNNDGFLREKWNLEESFTKTTWWDLYRNLWVGSAVCQVCLWQSSCGSDGCGWWWWWTGSGGLLAALLPPVSPLSRPGRQAVLGGPSPR